LKGYKLKEKQRTAIQCIFNLFVAKTKKKVVADNRDNSKNYLRIQTWDALETANLLRKCLGSEESRKVARYRATGLLLVLIEQYHGPYWDTI
jgi:hypothetical protein